MTEGESGKQEKCINAIQGILRQLRGRARWLTQNNGSCGAKTAVVMSLVALGGAVGLTIASLPLFESKPGLVLATPTSEKPVVAQISTPTPTPVVGSEPIVIEATLSRGKALNGLVFGGWLKLAKCPESSYGWQVRYLQEAQGEGFYGSSGSFTKARGTNFIDRTVYNQLYINPNKELGIHEGPVVLECLARYKGSSSRITESHPLKYRIEFTP